MTTEVVDVVRFSDTEKLEATSLRDTIEAAITKVNSAESVLEYNYAELGGLLLKVSSRQFWRLWGFPTWTAYMLSVRERMHRGRTQTYECIGIARKLLPLISQEELALMGITKAKELKRLVGATGSIPRSIVARAIDSKVTIEQLRADIFEATNLSSERAGIYFDLGGFYATKEDREEIEYAFDIARKTDPIIRKDIPAWAQLKQIIQRLCQEYVATYASIVEGASQ